MACLCCRHIVLIRHPISHLQTCYYDNDWDDYAENRPFNYFVSYKYHHLAKAFDFDKNLPYRNIQLFIFGFPPSHNDNRQMIKQKIDQVSSEFDLVMIQEHMMESLVLLKHELDLAMEDVVTFSLHPRPEDYEISELDKDVNDTIIFYNEGR